MALGVSLAGKTSSDAQKNVSAHKAPAAAEAAPSYAAAAPFKDLSVHLCFICLLHLANEHGLQLSNHGQLDTLTVSNGGASATF